MYSYRSTTRVGRSAKGDYHERNTDNQANTDGLFWTFDEYLKEEIWETEKYCWILPYEKPAEDGSTGGMIYITDEQKNMLRELMDQAVGVTKAQNDIYGMFLEEMDAYINGNKDLDSCCDILQNRVQLYLNE